MNIPVAKLVGLHKEKEYKIHVEKEMKPIHYFDPVKGITASRRRIKCVGIPESTAYRYFGVKKGDMILPFSFKDEDGTQWMFDGVADDGCSIYLELK